jgi:hypothetical protein
MTPGSRLRLAIDRDGWRDVLKGTVVPRVKTDSPRGRDQVQQPPRLRLHPGKRHASAELVGSAHHPREDMRAAHVHECGSGQIDHDASTGCIQDPHRVSLELASGRDVDLHRCRGNSSAVRDGRGGLRDSGDD